MHRARSYLRVQGRADAAVAAESHGQRNPARGDTVAALTVPYVGTSHSEASLDAVVVAARAAAAISVRLGAADAAGRANGSAHLGG